MPDISEYIVSGNGTLKPHDFDDDAEVVIEGHRMFKWENQDSPTHYLKFAGYDKDFRCGTKNLKRIAEMYGSNTDNWIGKPLHLFKDKTNNPKTGEEVDTMLVRVKKTPRNAPKVIPLKNYDERNPPPPLDDEVPF